VTTPCPVFIVIERIGYEDQEVLQAFTIEAVAYAYRDRLVAEARAKRQKIPCLIVVESVLAC
jgi:hypothetical protein